MPRKRSIKVMLWISKDELIMLDEIACKEYECNRSLAIRSLIRKYYESIRQGTGR
jgi:metal-responsive CopG/Arc/MetJ family transcriptional regulator